MEGILESFKPILEKYKAETILLASAGLILMISIIIFFGHEQNNNSRLESNTLRTTSSTIISDKKLLVDVSGAVENPAVYEASFGARLRDVLVMAGGLSVDADRQFFSRNMNLAKLVQDQEKIYIPFLSENQRSENNDQNTNVNLKINKLSIATASQTQLETLPGIGPAYAQKILQGRPYSAIEDLLNKKILPKSLYDKIKDHILI